MQIAFACGCRRAWRPALRKIAADASDSRDRNRQCLNSAYRLSEPFPDKSLVESIDKSCRPASICYSPHAIAIIPDEGGMLDFDPKSLSKWSFPSHRVPDKSRLSLRRVTMGCFDSKRLNSMGRVILAGSDSS